MRIVNVIAGATALTAAGLGGATSFSAPANASNYGFELNGTYEVLSNGEWAKSNQVFKDEPVVRSIWQISSECSTPYKCTGTVVSNQGWTAPLVFNADRWLVDHDIPNWAPCEPGSGPAATGHQLFLFYGTDSNGQNTRSTDLLAGKDITSTDSGSCGRNPPLFIDIPLRLTRIS